MVPPFDSLDNFARVEISDTAITGTAIKLNSLVKTVGQVKILWDLISL